jgi:hypothetical protein
MVFDISGSLEKPTLVAGIENISYSEISPVRDDFTVKYFQGFSLLGITDRDSNEDSIQEILHDAGVTENSEVGVAGWKHYGPKEVTNPDTTLEVPSIIADSLRELAGGRKNVHNANALFMESPGGMRVTNDVHSLARFEYASCHTSESIKNLIFGIEPGMTEYDAGKLMNQNGMPRSAHPMLSTEDRADLAFPSPSSDTIERGDRLWTAYGVWGAMTGRCGFVVEDESELDEDISDYVDRFVTPYYAAIADVYEHLKLGAKGGKIYDIIEKHVGNQFFGVSLNPGHLIHLDEFVDTWIYQGSTEKAWSGMYMQMCVIPHNNDYFRTFVEDGIALADDDLREELKSMYPAAWERIQKRRLFMKDELGIELSQEVLPFSNIPGYLPPFLLSPQKAMKIS